MGNYQDIDYRLIEVPDDLTECSTKERRAYLWQRIQEHGHPGLLDKDEESRKLDITRRQVYYDLDAISQFVEKELVPENHVGQNMSVFEKAKREALREGDWDGAVDILRKQAEWLENRGALDKESSEVEVTWRKFVEEGKEDDDGPNLNGDPEELPVEVPDDA